MNRSYFSDLRIDNDVVDKIMKEYNKSVKTLKNEISDYLLEIKHLKSKSVDIDKVLKDKEDEYKKKLEKYKDFDSITSELANLKIIYRLYKVISNIKITEILKN